MWKTADHEAEPDILTAQGTSETTDRRLAKCQVVGGYIKVRVSGQHSGGFIFQSHQSEPFENEKSTKRDNGDELGVERASTSTRCTGKRFQASCPFGAPSLN